jgi:UDP-glucose 4-epimerase
MAGETILVVGGAGYIGSHMVLDLLQAGWRAGDPAFLVADSGKIRNELGWQPRHEKLETIIETAWAWHRKEAARNTV